jgi:hypothetical protein
VQVSFGTWAEGGLEVFGALLDYPGSTFPPNGTLLSNLTSPPVVQISPTTWTSTVDLQETTVFNPIAATATAPAEAGPYVCH